MTRDLTITPAFGDAEGFNYKVTIFDSDKGSPAHQSVIYKNLAAVESALTDAGWPQLADKAGKTLELGHEFSSVLEISDAQMATLLRRS